MQYVPDAIDLGAKTLLEEIAAVAPAPVSLATWDNVADIEADHDRLVYFGVLAGDDLRVPLVWLGLTSADRAPLIAAHYQR